MVTRRHPTLHQLEIMTVLARHRNMTQAAKELHMSTAALSVQVKQLAAIVGAPLHEQVGKQLFLTGAGRQVELAAQDILERLEALYEALEEDRGLERGTLKVSVVTTAKYFVPRLLGRFCKQHPGIDVSLEVDNRHGLLERLAQNLDDLYVMGSAPEDLQVVAVPFMENRLVVVAPVTHPLVGRASVPPAALNGEPFVMREPGSGTRLAAERFFASHKVHVTVRMTLGSTEAIKQAVAGELGLAVLSAHAIGPELTCGDLAVLDVVGFPLVRWWYALHPAGKRPSPIARAFLAYLEAEGAASASPVDRRPRRTG